jgi:sentrin-specific protease 1
MIRHPKPAKLRVAVNGYRKAGRGTLDYKGCETDEEIQRRNDDFFSPPELWPLNASSKFASARIPEDSDVSSDEEKGAQYLPSPRPSDEPMSPRMPKSRTATRHPDLSPRFAPESTLAKLPQTPESLANSQSPEADDGDISKRLEGLLVTPADDQEQELGLNVSSLVRRRQEKEAKARREEEKEKAILDAKARRLSRRNPLRPLVQPLSEKWEDRVRTAQRERGSQRVLVTAIRGTELAAKDFATLLGHRSWLNDEIINAYLEWIEDAANKAAVAEAKASGEPASDVPKFIAQNSFFYNNLVKKGPQQSERLMKRKKAPGKSFMLVDTMFVPVNNGAHWTVGVVRPVAKTIEYFDSLGGSDRFFVNHMRKWLQFQLGDAYREDEWTVPGTGCAIQSNSWDCGVFVCTNSFCVAFGLDTSCYIEPDMIQQRRNIAAVLLNRGFVGDFEWGKSGL